MTFPEDNLLSALLAHLFQKPHFGDHNSVGPSVKGCPWRGRGRKSHITCRFLGLSWYTCVWIIRAWQLPDGGWRPAPIEAWFPPSEVAHLTAAGRIFSRPANNHAFVWWGYIGRVLLMESISKFQLRMLVFITSGKEQPGSQPKEEWKNCSCSKHCGIAFWNRPKHNDAISHHFTGFQLYKDSVPLSHTDDILLKNWGFVATFKS